MTKRIVCLLVISIMFLSLSGCGAATATTTTTTTGQASTTAAATKAATGTAPAASGEEIKIGNYSYLTGKSASLGIDITDAAKLAVKQLNAAGGIKGRPVKLIVYDDQASTELTVQVVTRLIDVDNVTAIIASSSSPSIMAITPQIEAAKVLTISGGVSPAWTNIGNKYVFRSTSSSTMTNQSLIDTMKRLGVTKLGVLTIASDYGKDGLKTIEALGKVAGIEVVSELYNVGDTDYTGQLTKMMNNKVSHLMVYGNTGEQALAIKQIRRLGYSSYIFGTEGCSSPEIRNVAGESANGTIFATTSVIPDKIEDAANDAEKAFLTAFFAEYGRLPNSDVSYRAYDAAQLIFIALKNAKSLDDRNSIREAMLAIKGYSGIAGTFDFTAGTGDGLTASKMYAVYQNKNIPLDKYLTAIGK